MNEIFILMSKIDTCNDFNQDIISAFATKELAQKALKDYVKDIKRYSIIKEYFNDDIITISNYEEYKDEDDYFSFIEKGYDIIVQVYIEKVFFVNK